MADASTEQVVAEIRALFRGDAPFDAGDARRLRLNLSMLSRALLRRPMYLEELQAIAGGGLPIFESWLKFAAGKGAAEKAQHAAGGDSER